MMTEEFLLRAADGRAKILVTERSVQKSRSQPAFRNLMIVVVSSPRRGEFLLTTGSGDASVGAEFLPSGCLGAAAFDEKDRTFWAAFFDFVKANRIPNDGIPVIGVSGDVDLSLSTALTEELRRGNTEIVNLRSAMAVLRREHQETRRVLLDMQNILWSVRSNKPVVTLVTAVGRQTVNFDQLMSDDGEAIVLRQRLPTAAAGLAGFDLYIAEAQDLSGILLVRMRSADDEELLASWVIDCAALTSGWLHFAFEQIVSSDSPYIDVEIEAINNSGALPQISLCRERFEEEFGLTVGGVAAPSTLAMRIWKGFPGTKNPLFVNGSATAVHSRNFDFALPASKAAEARPMKDYNASFDCVSVWGDGRVLVHPLRGQEVAAIIQHAVTPQAERVEAVVEIRDRAVNDVQFAICALPASLRGTVTTFDETDWVGGSGWISVSSRMTEERIAMTLAPASGSTPLDLYLFTRVPNGNSVDFAQATFSKIEIGIAIQTAPTKFPAGREPSPAALPLPETPAAGSDEAPPGEPESVASDSSEPYRLSAFASASELRPRDIETPVMSSALLPQAVSRQDAAMLVEQGAAEPFDHPTPMPDPSVDGLVRTLRLDQQLQAAQKLVSKSLPFDPMKIIGSNRIMVHPILAEIFAVAVPLTAAEALAITAVRAGIGANSDFIGEVNLSFALLEELPAATENMTEEMLGDIGPQSPWFKVGSNFYNRVVEWLPARATTATYLCLITRVPRGGSVDFSSPYFENIEVDYLQRHS